jgi:hypothetical protein
MLNEMGDKRIAECLLGLAIVARMSQQRERAVRLMAATEALLEILGAQLETASRLEYESTVAGLRADLGEDQFALVWADGRAMTLEQVVAFALVTP